MQFVVIPLWSKCVGFHAEDEWQLSHSAFVAMCVAFLPVAVVPLWQEEQLPTT
jgi:hypothetical protein